MQSYRLHVLDEGGRVVESIPFRTSDDEAACGWASHAAGERRFELWHERRRVHCSHKGPSVLDSFFEKPAPVFTPAPVWLASCAIR